MSSFRLPTHHHHHHHHDKDAPSSSSSSSYWYTLRHTFLTPVLASPTLRKIFYFLLLNLAFTGTELLVGHYTHSLGLVGDGLHMLLDSTGVLLSLIAGVMARWSSTSKYAFGYGRVEIVASFANCIALGVTALGIMMEALERLSFYYSVPHHSLHRDHPHRAPLELTFDAPIDHATHSTGSTTAHSHGAMFEIVESGTLLSVAWMGLLVNLVGIFAFHEYHHLGLMHASSHHSHHDHSHHDHSHHGGTCSHSHGTSSSDNPLMEGVFLHILADTLGSVSVIISSTLIYLFNWHLADPICSLFISLLILVSIRGLLLRCIGILMESTPEAVHVSLRALVNELQLCRGVVGQPMSPSSLSHSHSDGKGGVSVKCWEVGAGQMVVWVSVMARQRDRFDSAPHHVGGDHHHHHQHGPVVPTSPHTAVHVHDHDHHDHSHHHDHHDHSAPQLSVDFLAQSDQDAIRELKRWIKSRLNARWVMVEIEREHVSPLSPD